MVVGVLVVVAAAVDVVVDVVVDAVPSSPTETFFFYASCLLPIDGAKSHQVSAPQFFSRDFCAYRLQRVSW